MHCWQVNKSLTPPKMPDTCYINVTEDIHLEVEYRHTPEGPRLHYDQPPDPAETEIEKGVLCGWVETKPGHQVPVTIDVTHCHEELSRALDYDKVHEEVQTQIDNQ